MKDTRRTIVIPVHPDEENVPHSLIHFPLSEGRYVTMCGPLAPKTLKALSKTLEVNKDALIRKELPDYSI